MNLIINSQPKQFSGNKISELIQTLSISGTNGIALAVNDKVVAKTEWEKYELKENDNVLIIKATQGG